MKRLLARALIAALAQTALQTVTLVGLAGALAIPVVAVNEALLFFATSLLGALWAVRQRVRGVGDPTLSAAFVPFLATLLYLAPRLVLGPHAPALATLAAVALLAPMVQHAWTLWVLRRPSKRAQSFVLLASILGAGLAAAILTPLALLVAVVLAAALGAAILVHQRRVTRDVRAFASWVGRVDVRPEVTVCPSDTPAFADPRLNRKAEALRLRVEQLALEAREDARARDQVADARALRTRFMAAMSHELRSPLNSIVGFSQILESGIDGELNTEQRESVTMIRGAAEELILLLTDILDLARLEAGKLTLHREWTPSVEILTEAIERGRAFVEGQDVNIEAELQPGLPPVHVDKRRIVQAVVGLFRNAAPSLMKTTIRLRARVAPGPPGPARHLRIEIHDALGAISQERVERIFEAFQEISAPTGQRVGGLGMALTLSRGLVRMHGGEVWADTNAGTVLCVALPLEKAQT